jgi:hypothetical protein
LENDAGVIRNPVVVDADPLQEQITSPVDNDPTPSEVLVDPIGKAAEKTDLWIKITASSLAQRPVTASGVTGAAVMPHLSVGPPTSVNSQTVNQVETTLSANPDAVPVNILNDFIVNLPMSSHTADEVAQDMQREGPSVRTVRTLIQHLAGSSPESSQLVSHPEPVTVEKFLAQVPEDVPARLQPNHQSENHVVSGESTPLSQMRLLQPPPAGVNHTKTPGLDEILCSDVRPNTSAFATDNLPNTENIPDLLSLPQFPDLSLTEFLPFRRPELLSPTPSHILADDGGCHWKTSHLIEIQTQDYPPWPLWIKSRHGWQPNGPDIRPRRYTTLGMISQSPGKFRFLVHNRKSRGYPHTLTVHCPAEMERGELRHHNNHLRFLQHLSRLPMHNNLAVYYDEGSTVWRCPNECIVYLSVSLNMGLPIRAHHPSASGMRDT